MEKQEARVLHPLAPIRAAHDLGGGGRRVWSFLCVGELCLQTRSSWLHPPSSAALQGHASVPLLKEAALQGGLPSEQVWTLGCGWDEYPAFFVPE